MKELSFQISTTWQTIVAVESEELETIILSINIRLLIKVEWNCF